MKPSTLNHSNGEGYTVGAKSAGVLITLDSLGQGGASRVAVLLANGFAEAGIPTRLVTMRDHDDEAGLLRLVRSDVSISSGGPPMGIRISKNIPALGHQHFERIRGARLVAREIRQFKPAVVLAANDSVAFTTVLARPLFTERPLFAMKLTSSLLRPRASNLRNRYRRRLFEFIFKRNDLVLTLSEADRKYLAEQYPSIAHVFRVAPNPYTRPEMLALDRAAGVGNAAILSAGRLVHSKRFDLMLRAFASIKHEGATLTICGDGPLKDDLKQLADTLGISDRVHFAGYVEDVVPHLKTSDLFLLTSEYEGLPAVVIEALACNVPVVTTESFLSARTLLADAASCIVVPTSDSTVIANAVDTALVHRNPTDLRRRALAYDLRAAVSAHISMLAQAVQARAGRRSATWQPFLRLPG